MKRIILSLIVAIGLVLTSNSFAQNTVVNGEVAAPAYATSKKHEHHPMIHQAIHKLRAAKESLQKAKHDYAGHRAKAIEHIDAALAELKLALDADKK